MKSLVFLVLLGALSLEGATATKAAADPFDRANPRSAVTAFLESCDEHNYVDAAQYLDLRKIPSDRGQKKAPGSPKSSRRYSTPTVNSMFFDSVRHPKGASQTTQIHP